MTEFGPITKALVEGLLECIDAVEHEPQVSETLIQVAGHLINAVDQLESQQRALTAAPKRLSEHLQILDDTDSHINDLTRDTNTPERLHLPSTWDHRLAPDDLPRIHKRRIPHITGTSPRWIPKNALTTTCAHAFGLPFPPQIGQEAGHPITARLATDPVTNSIHVVIGGYILATLDAHTDPIARRHMAAVDSPCIEIDAKLTRGQDNTWRIIYYV